MAIERIRKEFFDILNNPDPKFSVGLVDDNDFQWKATLFGPNGTPYQGGLFHLSIYFPSNYPFKRPKVVFETKIYNPNVKINGSLCSHCSFRDWSPAMKISKALHFVWKLLNDPMENPNCIVRTDVGQLFATDLIKFNEIAHEWTVQYAQE